MRRLLYLIIGLALACGQMYASAQGKDRRTQRFADRPEKEQTAEMADGFLLESQVEKLQIYFAKS